MAHDAAGSGTTMTETDAGSSAGVPRRKLPIGIQTFRIIREEGYYYVDKTAHVRRLIDEGTHYFLSRPRRFGKSLLLDTVKELFEGAEPLFRGLAVHDGWDWSVRHPVVRLSFGSGNFKDPDYLAANLLLFDMRRFKAWWFETGTPTFLIDTLVEQGIGSLALERMTADDVLLSAFDVGAIGAEALLFQTGYLTIEAEEHRGGETVYRLGYPNREVRQGLNGSLLTRLAEDPSRAVGHADRLYDLLQAGDFDGLEELLKAFFAGIPYQWHVHNDIADYEGYYASVFYALFAAAGLDLTVEDSTSRGRVDLTVRLDHRVCLFEFKVVESAPASGASARPTAAMTQLRERGYADKYRASGGPVHLIAVEFSKQTRNVAAFETAPA